MLLTQYVLENLGRRNGSQWLGASRAGLAREGGEGQVLAQLEQWDLPLDQKTRQRLKPVDNLVDLLHKFSLKSVRLDSQAGLLGFIDQSFALDLRHDIPTPREMLERQCEGKRFVTLLLDEKDQERRIGRFNGAFEFVMHDLEHANKFFGEPASHRGQVRFFNLLRQALPAFEPWQADPLFVKDMDYLMSDMNSHPVHLFKYLKAVVLTSSLRVNENPTLDNLWTTVADLWQMDSATKDSALKINRPGLETADDQRTIADFFMRTNG